MTIKEYDRRIKKVEDDLDNPEFRKIRSGDIVGWNIELKRLKKERKDLEEGRLVKEIKEQIKELEEDFILYREDRTKEILELKKRLSMEILIRNYNLKSKDYTAIRMDKSDYYPIYFEYITIDTHAQYYVCVYVDNQLEFLNGSGSFTVKELSMMSNLLSKVYRKEKEWKKYDENNP